MGGSSNSQGVDLSSDEEGSTVGAKLLEEGGEEVDGLEGVNVGRCRQGLVENSGDQLASGKRATSVRVKVMEREW